MYNLLIRGGKIYDGTGSPWFYATVAVEGNSIRILRGDTSGVQAHRVIDATGLAVCPGFFDMHSHSTMAILNEPRHEPKVRQGVTTELIGVDGNSYAPFVSDQDLEDWSELDAGLDGEKPPNLRWSSVAEYLDVYDRKVAVNIAYVIGNSPLRIAAMGWDDRRPTSDEARKMRELLRQGMREGALGMSTGLDYPPGSYASTDELVGLCEEVAELGGVYVTHVRYNLGDRFIDPFEEALQITRLSHVPLHISHFASTWTLPGQPRPLMRLVDNATAEGLQVTFDAYPGINIGSRAVLMVPPWAHDGGVRALKDRLRDPATRARIADDPHWGRFRSAAGFALTGFARSENRHLDGLSIKEISQAVNKDSLDALCDLLLEEDLRLSVVGLRGNPVNVRKFLAHPACMVGSDAILVGDHPSPRTYNAFANMLGDIVRDEVMDLPEVIRKMTSLPAQRLGLTDRGILWDGFAADVVVFDPEQVRCDATVEQPKVFPEGIPYVVVNGELVIDQRRHTGALPGRTLTRGSSLA